MTPSAPARFGIVGTGWRTGFFRRAAAALPDRLQVVGAVTRTPARGRDVEAAWGVPSYRTPAELVAAQRPDAVIVSVPREAAPAMTTQLVQLGVPVLCETPPAVDEAGLAALWREVGSSGLVQVAEQYLLLPSLAARLAVVRGGAIGTPTQVQVSSTHDYHAASIIRGFLAAGFADADVTARALTSPLADPLTRDGWTGGAAPHAADTTLALLDFGGGRTGLYDFTDNQWFNPLRSSRIVVRGSAGELADDAVVHLADERTAVTSPLVRRQTGTGGNLEGFDLDHISFEGEVVYRNPYPGARLAEEEIAIATLLDGTAAWARDDAEPPYPLAQACQDHLLALAIGEAVTTGTQVLTARGPWAS